MNSENVSHQGCEKFYEIHVAQNHVELCVAIYELLVVRQLTFCVKHFIARLRKTISHNHQNIELIE